MFLRCMWFDDDIHMGGCQNYGPLLGALNIRCRIIRRTQKGTLILTTIYIYIYITYTGFWSTILAYFFGVPVPLRNHYEIKVYTFVSLATSKSSRYIYIYTCLVRPNYSGVSGGR